MTLILSVETSSSDYSIALGTPEKILYHSADIDGLNKNKDLGLLLRTGLKHTGCDIKEVDFISINIGPGGLGAVRSGVSFANGLSYGLGTPLLPLTSFELTGFQVSKSKDMPVLTTSNAADGHAYGGLYHNGDLQKTSYGPLIEIAPNLTGGLSECALAGTHQEKLLEILPDVDCVVSGVKFASAVTQIELATTMDITGRFVSEPVGALNELSNLFQDREKGT